MNLYSVAIDTLRRFAARHRAPRVVKQRTYVFFLFPFDFSNNGDAKKAYEFEMSRYPNSAALRDSRPVTVSKDFVEVGQHLGWSAIFFTGVDDGHVYAVVRFYFDFRESFC